MKKPRPFSLKPIYIDEHRERLAQAEQEHSERRSFSLLLEK